MANKFHKLTNNESEFPHIGNVDVYKFDNEFDYARYDRIQMHLQICTVPWDVGEAHVGQRTISGIGNVVWFETKEKRDAWFDAIPNEQCYRLETKYKELHSEQTIDVPIPFDVCAKFNYLRVQYEPFANADSYIQYERENGLRDWFWFIREVEFISPNNTRLHLLDDAFQTWMYDVNIAGMVLERGHAPMFAMKADKYLENPIENNTYLLTEDVNYGSASQVKHIDALALNSNNVYACIATTANPRGTWGSKAGNDWKTPAAAYTYENGAPSVFVFAIQPAQLSTFLTNVTNSYPQFKQTIQGIFFASASLITLADKFTFANVTCYTLTSERKTFDLTELNKSLFGYENKYQDIAKLYTFPYAHIEITDESGSVDIIKIEDTTGNIDVSASLSLAYPFITIDTHLLGVGGTAKKTITFRNVDAHTFDIQGAWYETLHSWNVPTFAVVLDAATEYDYSTHFDRAQRKVDYDTQYSNSIASTNNANTNALAQNSTAKTNEDASADTSVSNTALQVAGNTAINTRSNTAAGDDTWYSNQLSIAMQAFDAGYTYATTNNEVNAEYASAAIGSAGGAISSVINGAASGGPVGAVMGLINGAINGATTGLQTTVSANLKESQAQAAVQLSDDKLNSTTNNNTERTQIQVAANTDNTNTTNTTATGITANSSATQKANATRIKNTNDSVANNNLATDTANAGRTRDQAISAINNDIAQAALREPFTYGNFANGNSATNKPMALFANIVTQSKSAIASAGDEFLRYGYMLDKQWEFNGNFNVGKYFTYWKLKDFWVYALNVPDMYMDKLRFFLFGGVTIWRRPEDIGRVTIYDNFA